MVIWNVNQDQRVWGRLGKFLRREGAEPKVAEMFYRVVTQTVLLFGSETWVLPAAMEMTLGGTHTGFMRKIMGKRFKQKAYGMWVTLKL